MKYKYSIFLTGNHSIDFESTEDLILDYQNILRNKKSVHLNLADIETEVLINPEQIIFMQKKVIS